MAGCSTNLALLACCFGNNIFFFPRAVVNIQVFHSLYRFLSFCMVSLYIYLQCANSDPKILHVLKNEEGKIKPFCLQGF